MLSRNVIAKVLFVVLFISTAKVIGQNVAWSFKKALPKPRMAASAVNCNGKIYLIGGQEEPYTDGEKTTYEYDPIVDTWTVKASMSRPRFNMATEVVGGKIYAIGGDPFLSLNEKYDPDTDTWTKMTPMPTPRQHLKCGAVNEKIYVIGGLESWKKISDKNEVYDPKTDSWVEKKPIPTPRHNPGIAVVNGKIYVIGGDKEEGGSIWETTAIVEAYDPVEDKWETKASLPSVRFYPGTVVVNNKIFVMGGWSDFVEGGEAVSRVVSRVDVYDPEPNEWSSAASLPQQVVAPGAASIGNEIYVIGGYRDEYFQAITDNIVGTLPSPQIEITYVANCGFLVSSSTKKILIDALFKDGYGEYPIPSTDIRNKMETCQAPFDQIDLILTTHTHKDHFDATMTYNHLKNNNNGFLVGSQKVVEKLNDINGFEQIRQQVVEITPDLYTNIDTTINNIEVKVLRLRHGGRNDGNLQHTGYIFKTNDITIFHSGDAEGYVENLSGAEEYASVGIANENIDIALLNRGFFWEMGAPGIEIVRQYIKPKHIVLIHISKNESELNQVLNVIEQHKHELPEITIFRTSMESKIFYQDSLTTSIMTGNNINMPSNFKLNQNYPNPFNPMTTIQYSLAKPSQIQLNIYNIQGQQIKTLTNNFHTTGNYTVTWDATDEYGVNLGDERPGH